MGPHRGGIDARERQRRRPACNSSDPRRSGSSAADQDGGSHPPAVWTRLQASNTWHPVADPSCGPMPTSSSHPITNPVTVPAPHGHYADISTLLPVSLPRSVGQSSTASGLQLHQPSFKQAVGVVVINGVGLPDTRNHEAEFPEGAGSPLPILGERAFGTP
ncbi:hypothetical protein HPB47_022035 [Ixodes persulcatus]|uniref:Uncharacterized protein n=1 Tax=Ixodes persulcatus TaxID=34615 RepID=A0AC60QAX8_IXOPE|nr:hypothetical protein HPB47_022035 [Ixodes persulcatus]